MKAPTFAFAGIATVAAAAPAGSGAPVTLALIGLIAIILYGIYDTTRSDR